MDQTAKSEEYLNQLAAIEPVYHREFGDVCRLYLTSGETLIDRRSIRGVKAAVTRTKGLNQTYLRELSGDELGRQLSLPLPLSANLVLVPLKMRQPLTSNDSAYGYVNLSVVTKVVGTVGGGAMVLLNSGQSIQVLASKETALIHLGEGVLLRQHFLKNVWQITSTQLGTA